MRRRDIVTQPGSIRSSLNMLVEQGSQAFIGTVVHRQIPNEADSLRKGLYWCDVQPERDTDAKVEYVPMALRVMNYEDDFGIIIVPKLNTEVLVALVDGRPTIDSCQEWDKLIIKKDDSNYIVWDLGTNNVEMKTSGTITIETPQTILEKAGLEHQTDSQKIIHGPLGAFSHLLGEIVQAIYNSHTHISTAPTLPTSPPVPLIPKTALSNRVKLDS